MTKRLKKSRQRRRGADCARALFGILFWLGAQPNASGAPGPDDDRTPFARVPAPLPAPASRGENASGNAGPGGEDRSATTLRDWIEASAASTWTVPLPAADGNGSGMRVEVKVGRISPRLRLAPCERFEPFLPAGTRLWGRSYIGVRCIDGASWTAMLPVEVSVHGPALVAGQPMRAGVLPGRGQFRLEEVDWTASPHLPVTDPALLEGRALSRSLAAGQVLRANDLRTPQTIAAGDPVRIRMIGRGFSIGTSGFALAGAGDGQTLRIRTETGKMLVGIVRDRTVEIRL